MDTTWDTKTATGMLSITIPPLLSLADALNYAGSAVRAALKHRLYARVVRLEGAEPGYWTYRVTRRNDHRNHVHFSRGRAGVSHGHRGAKDD